MAGHCLDPLGELKRSPGPLDVKEGNGMRGKGRDGKEDKGDCWRKQGTKEGEEGNGGRRGTWLENILFRIGPA